MSKHRKPQFGQVYDWDGTMTVMLIAPDEKNGQGTWWVFSLGYKSVVGFGSQPFSMMGLYADHVISGFTYIEG